MIVAILFFCISDASASVVSYHLDLCIVNSGVAVTIVLRNIGALSRMLIVTFPEVMLIKF